MSLYIKFFSLCLVLSLSAIGWGQKHSDASTQLANAAKVAAERVRLGEQLTTILADQNAPVKDRHEAARLLGELQYAPAIDLLIQQIELVDPVGIGTTSNPSGSYPLVLSLGAYGAGAIPQMVDAYLSERNSQIQTKIFWAIRGGKTTTVARRYLLGIEPPTEDDWLRKQNIDQLRELLDAALRRK